MSKATRRSGAEQTADLLMIVLCCTTSFFVLASPLVPYVFNLSSGSGLLAFASADLLLSAVLSGIGVVLNHRVRGDSSMIFRRRRE